MSTICTISATVNLEQDGVGLAADAATSGCRGFERRFAAGRLIDRGSSGLPLGSLGSLNVDDQHQGAERARGRAQA